MSYKIFWVSDDTDIGNQVVEYCLEHEGWLVTTFGYGSPLLSGAECPDLWILDADSEEGFKLMREIRKESSEVGIILISGREKLMERVLGLELGCDDFIVKPFAPRELVLRAKRVLERHGGSYNDTPQIRLQDFWLDINRHMALYQNRYIDLTAKEFNLLLLLAKNKGLALSREQIIRSVWGENYIGSDRVVDDLIRRIRKKMVNFKVETLYGYGYRLRA